MDGILRCCWPGTEGNHDVNEGRMDAATPPTPTAPPGQPARMEQPRTATAKMEACPRFNRCSAPICPLYGGGIHLTGEDVCFFAREAVKEGGEHRLRLYLSEHMVEGIVEALPRMRSLSGDITRRLTRASKQGSKLAGACGARKARAAKNRGSPDNATSHQTEQRP
jgi:hypothetical protein